MIVTLLTLDTCGGSALGQQFRHFSLDHRALAAFMATWLRCSAVIVSNRRLPPIFPPLRPMARITLEISALLALGGLAAAWGIGSAVDRSTMRCAAWLTSLGLLLIRFGIPQVCHRSSAPGAEFQSSPLPALAVYTPRMPYMVEHLERIRITIRREFRPASLLGLAFAALWDYSVVRYWNRTSPWFGRITAFLVSVSAIVEFLWLFAGEEIVEIGADVLRHRKQLLLLHWTDNYPIDGVENLHWVPAEKRGQGHSRSAILFEYRGRPARIADGITQREFEQIMVEVSARYPDLAKRWRQSWSSDPAFTWLKLS